MDPKREERKKERVEDGEKKEEMEEEGGESWKEERIKKRWKKVKVKERKEGRGKKGEKRRERREKGRRKREVERKKEGRIERGRKVGNNVWEGWGGGCCQSYPQFVTHCYDVWRGFPGTPHGAISCNIKPHKQLGGEKLKYEGTENIGKQPQ